MMTARKLLWTTLLVLLRCSEIDCNIFAPLLRIISRFSPRNSCDRIDTLSPSTNVTPISDLVALNALLTDQSYILKKMIRYHKNEASVAKTELRKLHTLMDSRLKENADIEAARTKVIAKSLENKINAEKAKLKELLNQHSLEKEEIIKSMKSEHAKDIKRIKLQLKEEIAEIEMKAKKVEIRLSERVRVEEEKVAKKSEDIEALKALLKRKSERGQMKEREDKDEAKVSGGLIPEIECDKIYSKSKRGSGGEGITGTKSKRCAKALETSAMKRKSQNSSDKQFGKSNPERKRNI